MTASGIVPGGCTNVGVPGSGQLDMFMAVRQVGDRVELLPHLTRWMSGDRFGTVESVGRFYLHVRMDKSGTVFRVVPENVKEAGA